jgi:hypothetical protein
MCLISSTKVIRKMKIIDITPEPKISFSAASHPKRAYYCYFTIIKNF